MKGLRYAGALVLTMLMAVQPALAQVQAQDTAAIWRTFAEKVEVGAALKVRLRDGRTFEATLVAAQPDVLLLQRKTRLAVPVEPVAYDAIVSLERDKGGGVSPGKAAAIGVAAGVGTFFAILFIVIANAMD
jgi:hypothetical protein